MTPLEQSIEHWRKNLALAKEGNLDVVDISGDKCALCEVHYENNCRTCPVFIKTEASYCLGTPWYAIKQSLIHDGKKGILVMEVKNMLSLLEKLQHEATAGEQNEAEKLKFEL